MACLVDGLSHEEGDEVWVHSMREGLQQVSGAGWHRGLVIGVGWHHVRVGGVG